jgi:hypothetical protein
VNETKKPESAYSGERTEITGPRSLRTVSEARNSAEGEKTATQAQPAPAANPTVSPESSGAGNALPGLLQSGGVFPSAAPYGVTRAVAALVQFLERTKKRWLVATGAIFVVVVLVTLQSRRSEQAKRAQKVQQEHDMATLTVEAVLARCGQPAEDVTKDMYPMLVRTVSYQPKDNERVVFEFSRTAEEKSEWLFLSMKDGSGKISFETPEAKIAALPCLGATK